MKAAQSPKTSSLFKFMTVEDVTLEEALALLSLPREIIHPFCDNPIIISNGPFGPYLKHTCDNGGDGGACETSKDDPDEPHSGGDLKIFGKSETRSLDNEDQLITLTLEEAVKKLKEPKKFGRTAKAPLQEFGKDPDSGNMVSLKDGKFGPYVTDGEYMASLALGDIPEDLTFDRALELLAEKRLKGPPKKKASAKKRSPKSSRRKK